MSAERRHSIRYRAYLPLRVQPSGEAGAVETLTKDLSMDGLRCMSPKPAPVASDTRLELMLATAQEPLALRAVVRWFRSMPYSDQFELGLAFEHVSPQSARRLSTYLGRIGGNSLEDIPRK